MYIGNQNQVMYLEFIEKLPDNEDESLLPESLEEIPPIPLLFTALVQLAAL